MKIRTKHTKHLGKPDGNDLQSCAMWIPLLLAEVVRQNSETRVLLAECRCVSGQNRKVERKVGVLSEEDGGASSEVRNMTCARGLGLGRRQAAAQEHIRRPGDRG